MNTPPIEIDYCINEIKINADYLDPNFILQTHLSQKIDIILNPFSIEITNNIIKALTNKTPYSVIRLGDGEANLLTYEAYPSTPILNLKVAKKIISMQQDRFLVTPSEIIKLKNLLHESIQTADIIGIIGLWRPVERNVADFIQAFNLDHRGILGHWRSIDYLIQLSKKNQLAGKILSSAHLYFSIIDNIQLLLNTAEKTLLITNHDNLAKNLSIKASYNLDCILVGNTINDKLHAPSFLYELKRKLPQDMTGTLCLIGAGPWSEIYCTWVKKRGGVAVDIGTGFDLLTGKITRPIHKILKLDDSNRYKL